LNDQLLATIYSIYSSMAIYEYILLSGRSRLRVYQTIATNSARTIVM